MNKRKHLKIGMDFHGVINQNPLYFKELACELIRRGHEVHIITGGPCETITQTLEKMKFCYTQSFAILDHYEGLGMVEYAGDGGFHIDDKLWDTAKAKYCKAWNIDLHIDDSLVYLQYFETPYCRYEAQLQRCILNGLPCLDFQLPAAKVVDNLEKMFLW